MTSAPNPGKWGRKGREVEWWRIARGVGVGGQREVTEVWGLAFQGDDEGERVWFGKWVAAICALLGTTFSCFLRAHKQKNATHPPTRPFSLCKASLLAGVACKTPWYALVVCGLALPLTSSSLNHNQFHLKQQPKTTIHRSGTQLAQDQNATKHLKITRATRKVSRSLLTCPPRNKASYFKGFARGTQP